MTPVAIRDERPDDRAAVRAVNERAFGGTEEATIVERLHRAGAILVSLVAVADAAVIGHIAFSAVEIEHTSGHRGAGLAPMAVDPAWQRHGVGRQLVHEGLSRCRRLGLDVVVVLGHPGYYPRFGFLPASRFGLRSEYAVPDDVFMALELAPGSLSGSAGLVRYHRAFQEEPT